MKSIQFKAIFIMLLMVSILSSCTKDSDTTVITPKTTMFVENFDNTTLTTSGWSTYNQLGSTNWTRSSYKNDGYAKISAYYGGGGHDATSWLISPAIDMDKQEGEQLFFQTCQDGFVKNSLTNSLELFVSTDYDGTNFANATWQKVQYNNVTENITKFVYVNSGFLDLSSYSGQLYFAFKYKGYAASNLNGGFKIDNIKIFY